CKAADFDYLIGSVHFLGHWGFDDGDEPWRGAGEEECEARYEAYFTAWEAMLASGLFQIAAHPDLIKIYSVGRFHAWLDRPESRARVRRCLTALRDNGMVMEVSSAGLRKACREIYPAPPIMKWAAELGVPVTFASDAHSVRDVGRDFDRLADYARRFGFTRQAIFERGERSLIAF
ncbi:MAG: PHP domain-containing protein, partial [Desulfovibrio sp.]|nr:PHP domain-containing protein [Desulfovibrio sp.]